MVVNAGRRLRPKQERESQACLRAFFLSEKSTLLRVRGAMPWARIFCLWEGRRSGWWTGRGWVAGRHAAGCGKSNTGGTACEGCAGEGKKDVFLFLEEKIKRCLPYLLGGGNSRGAAIAALGMGAAAKTMRTAAQGGTQLVEGCGRRTQLIQLIYLRYLCGSAEREKRMDVCFLLTLYIQYITNFYYCQKWKVEENGRGGKFWKARDCGRWIRGKVCVGRNGREVRWLPPKVFFLTFLWFYGILTVFSRENRKRGTENVRIR